MPDQNVIANKGTQPGKRPRFLGQFIIKKWFQFKFSLIIFALMAISAFILWIEGHLLVDRMIQSGLIVGEEAIENLKILNKVVAQTSVLTLAIAFFLSMYLTHYVAGPVYRFERVLEEMRGGNLVIPVKVRKHDEFKEVADAFNLTLASLRNKLGKDRHAVEAALEKFQKVAEKLRKDGKIQEASEIEHIIVDLKNTPPQIKI